MIDLGGKTETFDDGKGTQVMVFSDHAREEQKWYLPAPVRLARRNGRAQFTLIKYREAAGEDSIKGGGFLMAESTLRLDPALERKIRGKFPRGTVLSPALFHNGTVECLALNLKGSGNTTAPQQNGGFQAVESILGATTPSLDVNNSAAFSLKLSKEGATILEQAFQQETTPVGFLYQLKYYAMTPDIEMTITADFERIYTHFSAHVEGQYLWIKGAIDAGFEKLKQEGAIEIDIINYSNAADREKKEQWALDFFKNNLLSDWFKPTLSPGKILGGFPQKPGQQQPGQQQPDPQQPGPQQPDPQQPNPQQPAPQQPQPQQPDPQQPNPQQPQPQQPDPQQPNPQQPQPQQPDPQQPNPQPSGPPSPPGASSDRPLGNTLRTASTRQNAALTKQSMPAGYDILHTPATSGTMETITIQGNGTPEVRVDGTVRPVNAQRQVEIDVPAGSSANIAVSFPAIAATTETFNLLFDYSKPKDPQKIRRSWGSILRSYLNNDPDPSDSKFSGNTAPSGNTSLRGAAALRDWLRNRLASPKQVEIHAHCSYENDPSKEQYNQELSQRRFDVAKAIIESEGAAVSGNSRAHGFTEAKNARPQPRLRNENDRIVKITGNTGGGSAAVTLNATLSRPAQTNDGPPDGPDTGQGQDDGNGNTNNGNTNNDQQGGGGQQTDDGQQTGNRGSQGVQLAFSLRFIHQRERKKLKLHYKRRQAVERTYAPQGFIGLLLNDLEDKSKHFVAVDLDHPFWRKLEIQAETPFDFEKIGLHSAQVALKYGSEADSGYPKHKDFVFDSRQSEAQKWQVGLNEKRDLHYSYSVQYNFDPDSDWVGEKREYELPDQSTEDRTLFLHPFDWLGFHEIRVAPSRDLQQNPHIIESTEVHLHYSGSNGWSAKKMLLVMPNSAPQFWKLRLSDPSAREYSYHFVHHFRDGSIRQTEPVTTEATEITVDPFVDFLDLIFIPALDATKTEKAYLDLVYDDFEDHQYRNEKRLTIQATDSDDVNLSIPLLDGSKRKFKYRFIFVTTDDPKKVRRMGWVDSEETIIAVTEPTS